MGFYMLFINQFIERNLSSTTSLPRIKSGLTQEIKNQAVQWLKIIGDVSFMKLGALQPVWREAVGYFPHRPRGSGILSLIIRISNPIK